MIAEPTGTFPSRIGLVLGAGGALGPHFMQARCSLFSRTSGCDLPFDARMQRNGAVPSRPRATSSSRADISSRHTLDVTAFFV